MKLKLSISARKVLNIIIMLLVAMICVVFVYHGSRVTWDFRNNLWSPAHLLVQGKSPYLISDLSPRGNAVWFPMVIGAFFPLGWLRLEQASMLWLIINLVAIVPIIIISSQTKQPGWWPFILGLLAFVLYPRTIAHLRLGQFTIIATLLFLLSVQFMLKDKLFLAAILVAVAISKPQLGVLVVPGLIVASWRMYGVQGIKFIFYLGLGVLLLTLPLFVGYKDWVIDFIGMLKRNPVWLHPSLFSLLREMWGGAGIGAWSILFLGAFALNLRIWQTQPPLVAVYWGLALTPLVSPYIWSWDFVMILPFFVWTMAQIRHYGALLTLLVGYLSVWILMFRVILTTDGGDHHFWWASWVMFILIAIVWIMEKRLSGQGEKVLYGIK